MSAKLESELAKANQELALLKAEYEEFVYIISHDLSAPLRQVQSFSEIIANTHNGNFDDKTKRHFGLIIRGATQASQMLKAMSYYSRLNTRAKPFALFDCNMSIAKALDNLSSLINDSGASITLDDFPEIIGDEEQITILFQQLIHNALTYQKAGTKPIISISFTNNVDAWQFSIKDNGIGVPENLREKIFKVLRRGVSDKKYPGLGMGLAYASKILQRHRGSINLVNSVEGAIFTFKIAKELPYG